MRENSVKNKRFIMKTSFVNYNAETKEKFQLHGTPTAKGNEILAGCYFNGWTNFGTIHQKWQNPYRVIKTQSGKFYLEIFNFKTPNTGSPIWELKNRTPMKEESALEDIAHIKEMVEFEDDNYFIN